LPPGQVNAAWSLQPEKGFFRLISFSGPDSLTQKISGNHQGMLNMLKPRLISPQADLNEFSKKAILRKASKLPLS